MVQGLEPIPKIVTGARFVDGEETNPTTRLINYFDNDAPVPETQLLKLLFTRHALFFAKICACLFLLWASTFTTSNS
jgi:hypothetical protein